MGAVDRLVAGAGAQSSRGTAAWRTPRRSGYWGKALGDLRAASHHSWMAARHMAVYGTTSEQLGAISVPQRAWACQNPEARMYGRPMTIEDHQNSPLVVEPYHLLDISLVSDGAHRLHPHHRRARQGSRRSRRSTCWARASARSSADLWWEKKNFTHMAVPRAKEQAFGAGRRLTLDDVDCAQFYDCFTAEVLFQLEDYGWCEKGEGGAFVRGRQHRPGRQHPGQHRRRAALLLPPRRPDRPGRGRSASCAARPASARSSDCDVALTTGHGGELVSPGMCSIHTSTLLGRQQ